MPTGPIDDFQLLPFITEEENMGDIIGMSLTQLDVMYPIKLVDSLLLSDPDLQVYTIDDPDESGANHEYITVEKETGLVLSHIKFQKGPIKEAGVNGIQNKQLLEIC